MITARTILNWRASYSRYIEGERGDNNVGFQTMVWSGHTTKTGIDTRWIQYADQNTGDVLSFSATTN